jgi:hypothetical protein
VVQGSRELDRPALSCLTPLDEAPRPSMLMAASGRRLARHFKSLASTSSATSALLISIAFSSQAGKCFPIDPLRVFASSASSVCGASSFHLLAAELWTTFGDEGGDSLLGVVGAAGRDERYLFGV